MIATLMWTNAIDAGIELSADYCAVTTSGSDEVDGFMQSYSMESDSPFQMVADDAHASFDFEAICAVPSLDLLLNSREVVGELRILICPSLREQGGEARQGWRSQLPGIELHTDSMGLVKAVRSVSEQKRGVRTTWVRG